MKQLVIILLLLMLLSCGRTQNDSALYEVAKMEEMNPVAANETVMPPSPIPPEALSEKANPSKKKIIKDGRMGLRVNELEKTKASVDSLVKTCYGYYGNEQLNNTDWESNYSLNIRIPVLNFEKFIAAIESGNGEILFKEVNARDVTDQFIDLETRLENKRNYLARYRELLKQAKSIKEILEIEEEIRGLEEEIESTTGRLKYLSDQVDYSTLDLTITKRKDFKYNPESRARFTERFKQALSKGWFGFVDFILFIVNIWPFWIIAVVVIYFWKKYRRTKKKE